MKEGSATELNLDGWCRRRLGALVLVGEEHPFGRF
jgi:hypothetical protein